MKIRHIILTATLMISFTSCKDNNIGQGHAPIVLGDSSLIVTETDSQYLQNLVMDVEVKKIPEVIADTHKEEASVNKMKEPEGVKPENGFEIDFGVIKVMITGIDAIEFRKQNPRQDNGVSYKRKEGDLFSSRLIVSGGSDVTIKQRYQSDLILRRANQKVDLKNMGIYTSEWEVMKTDAGVSRQSISLSSLNNLNFKSITPASLKNAVAKELRQRRVNNKVLQDWYNAIKNVKSAKDAPCEIVLNNVQWQISGKDDQGRQFFRTIRLDY